jgi:GNAT superfamily N-acetyltransferase
VIRDNFTEHIEPELVIKELESTDVDQLRLGLWSQFSNTDVKQRVLAYPGRSVWLPATLEFAIVTQWRNREEIANVLEISALRNSLVILDAVSERARSLGASAILAIELDEVRAPAFYGRAGFDLLEEVITYEMDCRVAPAARPTPLRFCLVDARDDATRELLVYLDHETFPWLWWNSDAEFLNYADAPGVELFVAYDGDEPIGYVGTTAYFGWGHLDRIAVIPARQGRGHGQEALGFAVDRLRQAGALKVGLSTQKDNTRSRRLYERFGFQRGNSNDYRLYGKMLAPPGRAKG